MTKQWGHRQTTAERSIGLTLRSASTSRPLALFLLLPFSVIASGLVWGPRTNQLDRRDLSQAAVQGRERQ